MITQADVINLANGIYGEMAGQSPELMKMAGSSVINRLNSGRQKEFGADIPEILHKAYYAVNHPNIPYKQALTQKFPDANSEKSYKQAMLIASGLLKGTIEPNKGLFYFTQDEIKKLSKKPKVFNFKKVKEVGKSGKYTIYDY
jgi:hypothetical protein